MRYVFSLLLAAGLLTAPAAFADEETEDTGPSKMEQGLQLFMDGLRQEMAPTVDSLRDWAERAGPSMRSFMEEMGPALAEMMDEVRDWTRYYPPEMLPNGDILIRRRPDPVPDQPEGEAPADEALPEGGTDI
ncbi:hypothetical protein [Pseudodonghicola flavimaris]|uniref:AAA+ family ATPase n=1 Tax=Pseudodonghicola flavimaris TaxID=3050036 RepID=A0ABT7F0I2_9RHOB|nr:hypothetical protein [Pseudodonghicola flavimaris]MDK3018098.1 hypothetical protein [Pseudodonghicola flavimaris]